MGRKFKLSNKPRRFTEGNVERSFIYKRNWWHLCNHSVSRVDVIQRWMLHAKPGQSRDIPGTLFIYIVCVE